MKCKATYYVFLNDWSSTVNSCLSCYGLGRRAQYLVSYLHLRLDSIAHTSISFSITPFKKHSFLNFYYPNYTTIWHPLVSKGGFLLVTMFSSYYGHSVSLSLSPDITNTESSSTVKMSTISHAVAGICFQISVTNCMSTFQFVHLYILSCYAGRILLWTCCRY